SDLSKLLDRIIVLLTPAVVENLPPYFQNINSLSEAREWYERMLIESHLFILKDKGDNSIIGFLFAYIENDCDAHIGYLLGEKYWRQGLATELLKGFINYAGKIEDWVKLIGGVDKSNVVSSKLLIKLGFVEQPVEDGQVIFYEYKL
ncbi:MAG: GNAT family N-acetyltransferase, partial [Proteobacteria bacterium]|nr:GNAT family N-acetyltransferase [Pseudomonadota bacterium]